MKRIVIVLALLVMLAACTPALPYKSYLVTVNYDLSTEEAITESNYFPDLSCYSHDYQYLNNDFFPVTGDGKHFVQVFMFKMEAKTDHTTINAEEVIRTMAEYGLRPATSRELLAVIAKFKSDFELTDIAIAALGDPFTDEMGGQHGIFVLNIPHVKTGDRMKIVGLMDFDAGYATSWLFAAVRK